MTNTMSAQEYLSLPTKAKATRRKPVQRESQLQQAAVRWFRLTYPQYAQLLFSIPNGGHRNIITAARMKAEGQVAGVPDLFLARPKEPYCGFFIELKIGKSLPTQAQHEMGKELKRQGFAVQIIRTLEDFQYTINTYLK